MELTYEQATKLAEQMADAFSEMAAVADKLTAAFGQMADAMSTISAELQKLGRQMLAEEYGRLPVIEALRGLGESSGRSAFHPRTLLYWIRTQFDLTPGLY